MRLDEFTFVPFEVQEKTYRYLAHQIGRPDTSMEELKQQLEAALNERLHANGLSFQNQTGQETDQGHADWVLFRTSFTTPTGEEIHAKCQVNKRPGAQQRWFGLFFQVARPETYVIGDMYFSSWHDGQRFLEQIADMAIPEKWTYNDYASKQTHPILRSYLDKTFERIKQQEKALRADGIVLWNTGLINTYFKEVYVVCEVDPEFPGRLVNPRPLLENDRLLLEVFKNKKPQMATFFSKITDVIFDPNADVHTDDIHIIDDNFDRIPREYQSLRKSQIFALFQSAIEFARIMARRNYKLVVPQFYSGRIQFLMPIYLSGEFNGPPDFALALEKIGTAYRGNTILTLDMAYQNARLIAKPENTWLRTDYGG